MLAAAETPLFTTDEAKKALIGLARDLRGLAFAFNTKTSYMMLFDWMYPFYMNENSLFYVCVKQLTKSCFNFIFFICV